MNSPRPEPAPGAARDPALEGGDDALLDCLALLLRLHGEPVSPNALKAGLPTETGRLTPQLFVRAAENHGWSARVVKRRLPQISNLLLPAVLLMKDGGACVLITVDRKKKNAEVMLPESGSGTKTVALKELDALYGGHAIFAHPRPSAAAGDEPPAGRSWFWGTLWRFKRYYAETMVAAVLINVLTLATSLFAMNVYDRVVPNNATATLWVLAIGTAIAIGFEFLVRLLRGYFIDLAGKKADLLLAAHLFRQSMSMTVASRPASTGAFASHLREFEALRDFFTSATLTTFTDLPFVFLFAWVISFIGGPLALVPLAAIPALVIAGLIAQWPLAVEMRRHINEAAARHGMLVEAVEAMETVKAHSAEGIMQGRWENFTALTAQSAMRSRFISAMVLNLTLFIQQGAVIAVIVWGVHLISNGELTVGALVACTILTGRSLASLAQLSSLLTRFQHARVAYRALNRVMKMPVERPRGKTFLHRPHIEGAFEYANVAFAYPNEKSAALVDVSFQTRAGEHVAILGRVGAGKSTLLKLMIGFYPPEKGTVLLDGVDLAQLDPADVRRHVGYVSQDVRLFAGTLRDNITLGAPLASDEELIQAVRTAGLEPLVRNHALGFDMPVGERGDNLSGGQKEAIALARALLKAPTVLLLDEPSASMDYTTEQTLITQLKTWARGRTLIIATHKPALLELVDRIIVLDKGHVAADGPRDAVLKMLSKPPVAAREASSL